MKIYILGSSGFIGRNLLNSFSSDGYDVKGFSSQECDLLFSDSIEKAMSSITKEDVIIITSFITRLNENTFDSMIKNIKMMDNISKFVEKNSVRQLIFLSTTDVYESTGRNILIDEKYQAIPKEYYSISKISSEFILKKYCSKNNIALTILRLPGIYGPGDEGKSIINKLVNSAVKGAINIHGDGEDRRGPVYIGDIYKIIIKSINKNLNITLNVSTGKTYSINKIVEMIKLNHHKEFLIKHKSKESTSKERPRNLIFNTSLFNECFPDFKFTDLNKGICLYIKNLLNK